MAACTRLEGNRALGVERRRPDNTGPDVRRSAIGGIRAGRGQDLEEGWGLIALAQVGKPGRMVTWFKEDAQSGIDAVIGLAPLDRAVRLHLLVLAGTGVIAGPLAGGCEGFIHVSHRVDQLGRRDQCPVFGQRVAVIAEQHGGDGRQVVLGEGSSNAAFLVGAEFTRHRTQGRINTEIEGAAGARIRDLDRGLGAEIVAVAFPYVGGRGKGVITMLVAKAELSPTCISGRRGADSRPRET